MELLDNRKISALIKSLNEKAIPFLNRYGNETFEALPASARKQEVLDTLDKVVGAFDKIKDYNALSTDAQARFQSIFGEPSALPDGYLPREKPIMFEKAVKIRKDFFDSTKQQVDAMRESELAARSHLPDVTVAQTLQQAETTLGETIVSDINDAAGNTPPPAPEPSNIQQVLENAPVADSLGEPLSRIDEAKVFYNEMFGGRQLETHLPPEWLDQPPPPKNPVAEEVSQAAEAQAATVTPGMREKIDASLDEAIEKFKKERDAEQQQLVDRAVTSDEVNAADANEPVVQEGGAIPNSNNKTLEETVSELSDGNEAGLPGGDIPKIGDMTREETILELEESPETPDASLGQARASLDDALSELEVTMQEAEAALSEELSATQPPQTLEEAVQAAENASMMDTQLPDTEQETMLQSQETVLNDAADVASEAASASTESTVLNTDQNISTPPLPNTSDLPVPEELTRSVEEIQQRATETTQRAVEETTTRAVVEEAANTATENVAQQASEQSVSWGEVMRHPIQNFQQATPGQKGMVIAGAALVAVAAYVGISKLFGGKDKDKENPANKADMPRYDGRTAPEPEIKAAPARK